MTSLFALAASFSLALFSRGALLAWGNNLQGGTRGDGSTASRSDTPVEVMLPAGATVRSVSAGCVDGYALTVKGHMLAWGNNFNGQLGNDTITDSGVPVRVSLPGWRCVSGLRARSPSTPWPSCTCCVHATRISAATPWLVANPAAC